MEEDIITCEHCGCIIEDTENAIYVDDKIFCDMDCANHENYYQCNDCGEWFNYNGEGIYTANGDYICGNCSDSYYYCDNCNEYYHEDDMRYVERTDEYVCENCYEDYVEDDDEPDNDIFFTYHNWNGRFTPRYTMTDLIETYKKHKDELKNITPYSTKKEYIIRHMLTIGFELETENTDGTTYRIEYCHNLKRIFGDFVHFEEDGSLHNGVEIISQPFTLNYLREHEQMFKDGLQSAIDMGYTSHNNGRCGLHFHINRNYFGDNDAEDVDKLNLFFETYKENIKTFSRRNDYHYCRFISDEVQLDDLQKLSLKVLNNYKNQTRYLVVNNDNYKTIEIRVMRGTLAFKTFMASAEFVFNIARVIENTNKIGQISWNKVVNFEGSKYIRDYIKERSIKNTIKFLVDKTKIVEKDDMEKVDKLFKYIESIYNGNTIIDFDMVNNELKEMRIALSHEIIETDDFDNVGYKLRRIESASKSINDLKRTMESLKEYLQNSKTKIDVLRRLKDGLEWIDTYIYRYKNDVVNTKAINDEQIMELRNYRNIKLLATNY